MIGRWKSLKKGDRFIVLEIRDNGIGIPEDAKEKIFSMFERLNDDLEGTGVGLNIVYTIVHNYGGKIEVESEEGKGSTFRILFNC